MGNPEFSSPEEQEAAGKSKVTFHEYGEIVKNEPTTDSSPTVPDLNKIREAARQVAHEGEPVKGLSDEEFKQQIENDDPTA